MFEINPSTYTAYVYPTPHVLLTQQNPKTAGGVPANTENVCRCRSARRVRACYLQSWVLVPNWLMTLACSVIQY